MAKVTYGSGKVGAPPLTDLSKVFEYIENYPSLREFKTDFNTWTADHCPFKICKKYVRREEFI